VNTCTKCKQSKKNEEFYKSAKLPRGVSSWCKACHAHYAARKYRESADERARKHKNRVQSADSNYEKLRKYLQNQSCVDCGLSDWRVLEFDHRDPSLKRMEVTNMIWRHSWEKMKEEMSKCDVRCANCHRIRTATQFGTWRSK
jgi:hypothetical protein